MTLLAGKKGLIGGMANRDSIAWACARAMHAAGAEIGATWQNDKARVHVEPLLDEIGAELRMPLDVGDDEQMRALFDAAAVRWGRLDFVLHAVAYAPRKDLQGRVVDSSRDRKSTRLNSSHLVISYAVFCLKKKKQHSKTMHILQKLREFCQVRYSCCFRGVPDSSADLHRSAFVRFAKNVPHVFLSGLAPET